MFFLTRLTIRGGRATEKAFPGRAWERANQLKLQLKHNVFIFFLITGKNL
jgi:hypothetical protein